MEGVTIPHLFVLSVQEPKPSEELGCVEVAPVPYEEPGGDNRAQEGDEDEPGDAQDPGQDAMLPPVAYGLCVEIPPWGCKNGVHEGKC